MSCKFSEIFWVCERQQFVYNFVRKRLKNDNKSLNIASLLLCLSVLLLTLVNSLSHAGGQTYSHTKAHCILWGEAMGNESAECRRCTITAAASSTTRKLKHQYKAKSGETWCVYKKQGFFSNNRKILISTEHCPTTYRCNRKVRWCKSCTTASDL